MPNRDGTGPNGKGRRTGRGLGPCTTGKSTFGKKGTLTKKSRKKTK